VQPLSEISIPLEFLTENFDLARFSRKHEYEMTLPPFSHDQQKNKPELACLRACTTHRQQYDDVTTYKDD